MWLYTWEDLPTAHGKEGCGSWKSARLTVHKLIGTGSSSYVM